MPGDSHLVLGLNRAKMLCEYWSSTLAEQHSLWLSKSAARFSPVIKCGGGVARRPLRVLEADYRRGQMELRQAAPLIIGLRIETFAIAGLRCCTRPDPEHLSDSAYGLCRSIRYTSCSSALYAVSMPWNMPMQRVQNVVAVACASDWARLFTRVLCCICAIIWGSRQSLHIWGNKCLMCD